MEKSRLLELLRTMSPQELREFRKFLLSPMFNVREDLVQLLDFLTKYLKKGKPAPEKEKAFLHLFPDEPFDDHRVRMLMSFLYQLACKYLTISDFMADELQSGLRLAGIFRRRKLTAHFTQVWDAVAEKNEKQPFRNAAFYEEKHLISLEKYRSEYDMKQVDSEHLQALSQQLDWAFLARKLWQACFLLSHEAVSNVSYDFGLLEEALAFAERAGATEKPAIGIYFHCYRALTNPTNKAYFQEFKALVLAYDSLFPVGEMRDLYILAINFCIRQYNAGNQEYLPDQFDFFKEGLQKGYFLTEGELSRYTFQNAVTSGLVMRQYDWVQKFIHDYRPKLAEQYRESVFSFNLARLAYERKDFDAALPLLQKAEYKDILLNLAAKTLQLKIFFELNELDLLDAHIEAFKVFLRRKKGLGYHRENYLGLLNFTHKLLEVNPFDKKEKEGLRQEIEGAKGVAERDWLLKQF